MREDKKVGSTYPEIWNQSGHSWLLTGLVGKAKIKWTWILNTGRGASETENIQFQFHTELFPLSFHIFSILLCSGCDSLLPALNYSRHDNLVKQRGGAFDRNQNRTSGDNLIWTTPGPPQATCSAQLSSTQVFVLFKIIKDSRFRNYFLKVMMGRPLYQAVSFGKI